MRLPFLLFFCSICMCSISQNSRSEIIKKVSYNEYNNYKLTRVDTLVVQINERMGNDDAHFSIPYTKGDKVTITDAWIEDVNGDLIRKIKKNDIKDVSAISNISLYEDDFVKKFDLQHNVYPYRVCYTTRISYDKSLVISALGFNEIEQPVKEGKLVVKVPINENIRYVQKNVEEPKVETIGDSKVYTWNYSHEGETPQRHASYNTSTSPEIVVLPLNFRYGKQGSWETWQTYGNWLFKLAEGRDVLPEAEKQKVQSLITGVDDTNEKLKILYTYLQDVTRYVNVKIDVGGLQPYPASYVSLNKYGDCKALTNFMRALLKDAGIQSYYTVIYLGDGIVDIDDNNASLGFNHVILTVPTANDTIYLECTSKTLPCGYIHSSIQGRKALLVDENNSHLITIPSLKQDDVLCSRNMFFNLYNSSSGNLDIKTISRGREYEFLTGFIENVNQSKVEKYIRNSIFKGNYNLTNYKFSKDRNESYITLDATCEVQNVCKKYGNNLVFEPISFDLDVYELPEKRTQDVQIDYPQFLQDTIIYKIENVQISKVPKDVELDSKYGTYKMKFSSDGDKFTITKSFVLNAGRYAIDEYPIFYEFMKKIRNIEIQKCYIEIL